MKYIGIDLGTTNSAICSYDGKEVRIWKSPEQNDVTPSAIYIDRRGNKLVGRRAYEQAARTPNNCATLFKRLMGTSTPIELPAVKQTKTPEECSAEILKTLYGYLPEEIRNDPDTGIVITVPAAFNQMQKNATLEAAQQAGLGKISLMQEPVAAVMSVMHAHKSNGIFLVYDLGGGTLDIAIAESFDGRVNLLAHGGIAMCGGRDFDRAILDNVVKPWLLDNFNLPEDLTVNPNYRTLMRMCSFASERAKIELSSQESSIIRLDESETGGVKDLDGNDIYIDIPFDRDTLDDLIAPRVNESIQAAKDTLKKAGLSPDDVERVVFVGGPTNYKPLRDKVVFELGVAGSTEVNPMTAVAEGAALFAESIDWSSKNRSRKSTRGSISSGGDMDISFNYIARTPDSKTRLAVVIKGPVKPGCEFQIDSLDTGWTSGKMPLKSGVMTELGLPQYGENNFKVFVFDEFGGPITLKQDKVTITRTAATVDAIPASYSVGIEVLEKIKGQSTLEYLVRAGDSLPKKGSKVFKAAKSLRAGSPDALNFKLWEGEIEDEIQDNRPIGVMKISGHDFEDGVIPAGAELNCEYEILDSGNIIIEISVPSIGSTFSSGKNFYSRQEGQVDYSTESARIIEDSQSTMDRIEKIRENIDDDRLDSAEEKLDDAMQLDTSNTDAEKSQQAMENVLEARKLIAQVRKDHRKEIRQMELDESKDFFDKVLREDASASEITSFDNLTKAAQRAIDRNESDFETYKNEIRACIYHILYQQDWFIIERFKALASSPHRFNDKRKYKQLVEEGFEAISRDDMSRLRRILGSLYDISVFSNADMNLSEIVNIIKG